MLRWHYPTSTLVRPCPTPAMAVAFRNVEDATLASDGSPPITRTTIPTCRAHYPGGSSGCACRFASPLVQPSPIGRRVGIRLVTFEACAGFTRVTARRIARPPKVTFVTRLRPSQLPDQAARQLPDLSVESTTGAVARGIGEWPLSGTAGASIRFSYSVSSRRSLHRTCRFPAYGARTGHHAFAHGRLRLVSVRRLSPNF